MSFNIYPRHMKTWLQIPGLPWVRILLLAKVTVSWEPICLRIRTVQYSNFGQDHRLPWGWPNPWALHLLQEYHKISYATDGTNESYSLGYGLQYRLPHLEFLLGFYMFLEAKFGYSKQIECTDLLCRNI